MSRTARIYGPNPRIAMCEPDSSINNMTLAYLIALNIAAFNTPKEKAMTPELLSTSQGEHLKEIRDSVYDEYETLRPKPLTLDDAIKVLNERKHRFDEYQHWADRTKDSHICYITKAFPDVGSRVALVLEQIVDGKVKRTNLAEFLTPFEGVAIAEKLLREGK